MMSPTTLVVVGICTFVVGLGASVTQETHWMDMLQPHVIIPALVQVAGVILVGVGAKKLEP